MPAPPISRKSARQQRPLKVHIVALPETTPMSVYGLYELFEATGTAWSRVTGEVVEARRIDVQIVSTRRRQFRSSVGVPITPHASLAEAGPADVVIVTDIALPLDPAALKHWRPVIDWLCAQLDAGVQVCSVCTGSIVLAEAGLLNHAEAASHWSAAALFRDRYPAVKFCPERILCNSGFGGQLITTGGASSWEDLALHLVRLHCGADEAVRLAKLFLLGDRSDGQLPFALMARPRLHEDALILASQRWLATQYIVTNPVAQMVARSGIPERSFKRRFSAATGYAPVDYVHALRIQAAKARLEAGADAIENIAAAVGYEDPTFFRRLFKRATGITPGAYRRRFALGPAN